MKTLQQAAQEFKPQSFDGRDLRRFSVYLPLEYFEKFGLSLSDPNEPYEPKEFTRENILDQLKIDLEFAFEKALDQRGLSSMAMFCVIKMWNWILEDGLENWSDDDYAMYGLPLYKATALKYGFVNPIGDDSGNESKYSG